MPYYTINDFAAGLDLRRSTMTAPAGTLRTLKNAHVTPGGEIEKRYAFVKLGDVDPSTRGLVDLQGRLYVFGHSGPGVEPPGGPANLWDIGVLKLQVPALVDIVDYDLFDNAVYAIVDTGSQVVHTFDNNLVAGAEGLYCRTYKTKMFTVLGSVLYFSAVGEADNWTGTGSGNIDLSLEDADMSECIALEVYYDKLAIFSRTSCQLWTIDPDPLKTQYAQTLRQAGTIAHKSVLQYGSGDVLYVSPDGIRSLRARNSSLAASVSDVGSPLDPLMQHLFRTMGESFMGEIISIIQPVTGRFWVILRDRIYVLSAFPGPKITAWSEYVPTDINGVPFTITSAVIHAQHVVVRDDQNQIFVYGGNTEAQAVFDDSPVEIEFPFLSGDKPATLKKFKAIDAAAEGVWDVFVAFNPHMPTAEDYLGRIDGPTMMDGSFMMKGNATHASLRLRSAGPGPRILSNMIIHYDLAQTE